MTKPPGCDATCAAAAAEGKKAAAVCRSGYRITKVQAPAYGLAAAGCNSPNAYAVVSRLCLGQRACYVAASDVQFGGDPCPQAAAPKRLAFTYTCAAGLAGRRRAVLGWVLSGRPGQAAWRRSQVLLLVVSLAAVLACVRRCWCPLFSPPLCAGRCQPPAPAARARAH